MKRNSFILSALTLWVVVAFASKTWADVTNQVPDFSEFYGLIRSHLAGMTDAELNRAAVNGLLGQLRGKVSITGAEGVEASNSTPLTSHAEVFDEVAYLRVNRVANGLANEVHNEWNRLGSTNKLRGLTLDLRFAGGRGYEAAAAVADLFTTKEGVLLDWGEGEARSTAKGNAITVPVAVLVNHETRGAAEALAAMVRETGAGLIFGTTTAGNAMVIEPFPLKDGQRVLIATRPLKLGDGSVLSADGVKPDIEVTVSPDAEREYFENAYAVINNPTSDAGMVEETNVAPTRLRINEADLVRERREGGTNLDELPLPPEHKPEKPVIRDPVLARAVDLLKGLAVVRGARS